MRREDNLKRQSCRQRESFDFAPFAGIEIERLAYGRGNSDSYGECRNVAQNHGISSDHGTFSDRGSGGNHDAITEPDVSPYYGSPVVIEKSQRRRPIPAKYVILRVLAMIVIGDHDFTAHQHVVPNLYEIRGGYVHEVANAHVLSDDDFRRESLTL